MTESQNPSAAEQAWLDDSVDEDFEFELFNAPKPLRRSNKFTGALADLIFGQYQDLSRQWVSDSSAVWLGMIVSDRAGQGGQLLDYLKVSLGKSGLWLIGTPSPLKPRNWNRGTPFVSDEKRLINWYMKHGFRVIQNRGETRVLYARQAPLWMLPLMCVLTPPEALHMVNDA